MLFKLLEKSDEMIWFLYHRWVAPPPPGGEIENTPQTELLCAPCDLRFETRGAAAGERRRGVTETHGNLEGGFLPNPDLGMNRLSGTTPDQGLS